MKKDFITVSPDSGEGGSTPVSVTADPNGAPVTRSTTLNFNAGGATRAVTAMQDSMPFYCSFGLKCNDQANGLLNVQLIPGVISVQMDGNGNDYMSQRITYKLSNPSEISDTKWYLVPTIIMSNDFYNALNLNAGSEVMPMALLDYRASVGGPVYIERLQLKRYNTADGYICFVAPSTTGIGDGGYLPAQLKFVMEFQDQNENKYVFMYEFVALS